MLTVWFDLTSFHIDITDIDEKQLVLYAQMANLVNLILQWPDINVKEIAENFSKVLPTSDFGLILPIIS